MAKNLLDRYFFTLFSIIPISLIIGPAVSLSNIVLIDLSFIILFFCRKEKFHFSNSAVKLLLIIYIYLIFNSLISIDPSIGLIRNLGFIRFVILFIAFNYFFNRNKYFNKIFLIWALTIIFICFDILIEVYYGTNLLGYGAEYGRRVVSFFKEEPIVGGYLNGIFLIVIGFSYLNYKKHNNKYKYFLLIFSLFIFIIILLTGERSNTIKAFLGILIFFILNKEFSKKEKFFALLSSIIILSILYTNSNYLKLRWKGQIIDNGTNLFLNNEHFEKKILKGNTFETTEEKITLVKKINIYYNENIYFKIYRSGLEVFKNNLVFGVGNKNYRVETCNAKFHKENPKYYCTTHPHQIYFEILSEHGVIGFLIIFSILFFLIFKILKKVPNSRNYLQLGCLSYVLVFFIPILPSGSFFSDFYATIFWTNFSIMYACNNETNIFFRHNH